MEGEKTSKKVKHTHFGRMCLNKKKCRLASSVVIYFKKRSKHPQATPRTSPLGPGWGTTPHGDGK